MGLRGLIEVDLYLYLYAKFAVNLTFRFREYAVVNGHVLADKTKPSCAGRCGLAGEGSHTFSHARP
jgi:hypothetical protein